MPQNGYTNASFWSKSGQGNPSSMHAEYPKPTAKPDKLTKLILPVLFVVIAAVLAAVTLSKMVENGVITFPAPPHFVVLLGVAAAFPNKRDWLTLHLCVTLGAVFGAICVLNIHPIAILTVVISIVTLPMAYLVRQFALKTDLSRSTFTLFTAVCISVAIALVVSVKIDSVLGETLFIGSISKVFFAGICVLPVAVYMPLMLPLIRAAELEHGKPIKLQRKTLNAPAFKYTIAAFVGFGMGYSLEWVLGSALSLLAWLSVALALEIWFTRRFDKTCPISLVIFGTSLSVGHSTVGFTEPEFIFGVFCIAAAKSFDDFSQRYRYHLGQMARFDAEHIAKGAKRRANENDVKVQAFEAAIANLTHDLKSPAATMQGLLDLISDTLGRKSAVSDELRMAQNQSRRLLALVDDVLDLTREEMGQAEVSNIQVDPSELLSDIVMQFQFTAGLKGLKLNFTNNLNVAVLEIDGRRIKRIVSNLLDNAIKYTNTGTIELIAKNVESADGKPMLCIDIKDSGIGIPPEQLETIFSKFQRARNHFAIDGLGLGLALVSRFTDLLDGELNVESKVNEGTTFSLRFPYTTTSLINENVAEQTLYAPPSILVVDDDPTNMRLTTSVASHFAQISEAVDGKEAVEKWNSEYFDIIFMDCRMPVMNGIEATKEIRMKEANLNLPHNKIVGLTSNASIEEAASAIKAGMDQVIEKPLTYEKMKTVLNGLQTR